MGTACHVALAQMALGRVPNLNTIARDHNVDPDDLERLYAYGCIAWRDLSKHFPNPRTEEPLEGDGIRGTTDVFHRDDLTMNILDWKTNRVKRDYRAQVVGYGVAAIDQFGMPECGQVQVCIVWLQFFEYEVITITQDDVERLHHDIERAKLQIGKRYAPGDSCTYCPRQFVCDARHEFLSSATTSLLPVASVELVPEVLPRLYTKAKLLRKALDNYDKALRMVLRSGPLPDGEGNILELSPRSRDKVDARGAWPVLTEAGFNEDDFAECVKISKTAILNVVGKKTKKGKGKAKAAMVDSLREAGAISKSHFDSILVKQENNDD